MKLILELPPKILPLLEEYSDAELIIADWLGIPSYAKRWDTPPQKERWLGYKAPLMPKDYGKYFSYIDKYRPDVVWCPQKETSEMNIVTVEEFTQELTIAGYGNIKTISTWKGATWELTILKNVTTYIGIPHTAFRMKLKGLIDPEKIHMFGLKYLNELKEMGPASISTSMPVRAALVGVRLSERQRRPKAVPELNFGISFTFREQYDLAVENIKSIKEAVNGYGKDS